jgi:hypothetical protein
MSKKGKKKLNLIVEIYGEKTLEKIDGFDSSVIGIEVKTDRLIYSVKKCIKILETKMPTDEAIDHFYTEIYAETKHLGNVIFCEDYLIKKPNI